MEKEINGKIYEMVNTELTNCSQCAFFKTDCDKYVSDECFDTENAEKVWILKE